jgi:hypothetical protein
VNVTEDQKRQQIVREFKRRARRQYIEFISLAGAVGVGAAAYHDPEVFGRSTSIALVPIAVMVVVACLVHQHLNWRCPACGHPFPAWYVAYGRTRDPDFCGHCGAVFLESKGNTADERERQRRPQLEAAVRLRLDNYRGFLGMRVIVGCISFVAGVGSMLYARPSETAPQAAWTVRIFGQHGPVVVSVAGGGLLALFGLALIARGTWLSRVHVPRLETRFRRLLQLPPTPAPAQSPRSGSASETRP